MYAQGSAYLTVRHACGAAASTTAISRCAGRSPALANRAQWAPGDLSAFLYPTPFLDLTTAQPHRCVLPCAVWLAALRPPGCQALAVLPATATGPLSESARSQLRTRHSLGVARSQRQIAWQILASRVGNTRRPQPSHKGCCIGTYVQSPPLLAGMINLLHTVALIRQEEAYLHVYWILMLLQSP